MYVQQKQHLKHRNSFEKIIPKAKLILKEYDLCDNCVGRLFVKNSGFTSNKLLGKRIKNTLKKNPISKCYICKNIFSNLQSYIAKMLQVSGGYQYSTFLVGAKLQPSIIDRDDSLRSKFKLRGIDSVKTDITQQLAKSFARKTKIKIDYHRPDLAFTIDFKNDISELSIRPLIFFGRYTKNVRGIPQKQTKCPSCLGKGCFSCSFHGISEFTSVEGRISQFLFKKFGGTQAKITWIGGEDKSSLVNGNGRPFFVKLLSPKKRKLRLKKNYLQKEIDIKNLRITDEIPNVPLQFRSKVKLSVTTQNKIWTKDIKRLQKLKKTPILVLENGRKKTQKFIYEIKPRKKSPKSFSLKLTLDGGLPLKRFVEGNDVHPNLTKFLQNQCKCNEFDFQDVKLLN